MSFLPDNKQNGAPLQHNDQNIDVQAQFLEAFKELLDLQNYRMTSQIGEIINQCYPHLIFPLILPTQVPNTYIVIHILRIQNADQFRAVSQCWELTCDLQLAEPEFLGQPGQPKIQLSQNINENRKYEVKEEDVEQYNESEPIDDANAFIKYNGNNEDKGEQKGRKKVQKD